MALNPKADKFVRRITMVATITASYFLLTADYGPEPNALDPVVTDAAVKFRSSYILNVVKYLTFGKIKNGILSAQNSVKEYIFGPKDGPRQNQTERFSSNKEHP